MRLELAPGRRRRSPGASRPAGLVSGPRKLKIVRTPSALRTGTTCLHRRVVQRGEHEAEADLLDAVRHRRRAPGRSAPRAPPARRPSRTGWWPSGCRAWRPGSPRRRRRSAAVVETLNVGRPPPVPGGVDQVVAGIAPAAPARASSRPGRRSRSTVSPFVRSAIRKAGGLRLRGVALHDLAQHARRPRRRRGPRRPASAVDRLREDAVVQASARKFAQQLPCRAA